MKKAVTVKEAEKKRKQTNRMKRSSRRKSNQKLTDVLVEESVA